MTGGAGAVAVAIGIFASRIAGLVRQKLLTFFLGAGWAADAFNLAFRIPNMLQNLFGEGVLSASFIPVYARLRAEGRDADRQAVAGAVLGILGFGVALLVLVGVLAAPVIVGVLAPGFAGEQRALTITLVRILFPGAGLLVLSAWCLGVLNAHGRFLLSYASPVVWNLAVMAALLGWGSRVSPEALVVYAAWGSVVGSALQLVLQWPAVLRALGGLRLTVQARLEETRRVFRNFGPAFVARGVTQLSAFVDLAVASLLLEGSATMLANAQVVYMLPVSLFGMSVSAAALPSMSGSAGGDAEAPRRLASQLGAGLAQVTYFVVPSAVAMLLLGDAIVGLLFEGGAFGAQESAWQRLTVAAAAVGLLAATQGRLYATTLFALQDTRTPLRTAIVRVLMSAVLGLGGALVLVPWLQLPATLGVVALVLGSALAAWVERALLVRAVAQRVPRPERAAGRTARCWVAALAAAAVAGGALQLIDRWEPLAWGPLAVARAGALALFGGLYLVLTLALGVPAARALVERVRRPFAARRR